MPIFKRTEIADEIKKKLSIIPIEIKFDTKWNTVTENVRAESFFCGLLNLIYGLELINLNYKVLNAPAIDLGDLKAGVSYQITSTNTRTKILDCVEKFKRHNLDKEYNVLNVFIIGEKKKYEPFPNYDSFQLQVIDIYDIQPIIESLSIERQEEILQFINEELIIEDYSREVKFKRGENYQGFTNSLPMNSLGYYTEQLISGIDKFGGILNQFNPRTRELVYAIFFNTTIVENRVHRWDITFYYKEIQDILGWDDEQLISELDVLRRCNWMKFLILGKMPETLKYKYQTYTSGMMNHKYSKELYDKYLVIMRINYFLLLGEGFLPSIIKYLYDKSSNKEEYKLLIKKMILDLDFTILN
ncbi:MULTISPECIES: SMEK domain-containing protein [unclassified Bacillus (in: firmicutes)]|uniref:SMEK domain-containing protein n=1 Tax=unclassified Bacillus (in: firmicutes) TaxID=185979 RepID=UPI00300F8892